MQPSENFENSQLSAEFLKSVSPTAKPVNISNVWYNYFHSIGLNDRLYKTDRFKTLTAFQAELKCLQTPSI